MTESEALLEAELKASRAENKLLKEKIDGLIRLLYGSKSEKLDPNQLMLLEELDPKKDEAPVAVEPETEATKKPRVQRPRTSPRLPDHLPVRETILDPEEVKSAPEQWRFAGEEVSEKLDYEPARFLKQRLIRRKYVLKDAPYSIPVIAPLPECLQERCLATPELIAQVVTSKYVDHQPLYRQEKIYHRRHGVMIPRQTLCRWMELAAYWLKPVYEEMKHQQGQVGYLQVDETPIRYLEPGRGKAAQGYFWVSSQPHGDVIYHWHSGRAAACLDDVISTEFAGTLQCDGYQAYASFQKQRAGPIELAGCWAHARRKFYESSERAPRITGWMLNQIKNLYCIERRLRERKAGPALRTATRASESAPILKRIKRALMILKPRYLPKSDLGKAITYAFNQWEVLQTYLDNGHIEIDNNLVENAIRPTKLGAKNWLFIGSEGSGQTSAILYTLVESAKRHGIEPYAYLCDLLRELPKSTNHQVPRFTPAAMARVNRKNAA